MSRRIVLAGGGTAGHVNPLLATAAVLGEQGNDVVVMGTVEGLESELVPAAGFELKTIPKVPIPRRPGKEMLMLPNRLKQAVDQAKEILAGADLMVGFGGYVSGAGCIAANRLGIPTVLHEQNARPGMANRYGARVAKGVGLTFPGTPLAARKGITSVTGMPLRKQIMDLVELLHDPERREEQRQKAANLFGLDPRRPTLLVTGGSLGAVSINKVLAQAAPRVPGELQILHATGKGKAELVREAVEIPEVSATWVVLEYIHDMDLALAVADLVLARSGAGTVAEMIALGKPAFYVPLPFGNGEQRLNAASHVQSGGALLVEDSDFTAAVFEGKLLPLLNDPERLQRMASCTNALSLGDGAKNLADLIERAS